MHRLKINLELQKIATQSLRNGLIAYDRRKGWRGPLKNLKYSKNWLDQIEKKFILEKSIEWQIAIIKKINQFNSIIETDNKLQGLINYKDISWTKKEFAELLKKRRVLKPFWISRPNKLTQGHRHPGGNVKSQSCFS